MWAVGDIKEIASESELHLSGHCKINNGWNMCSTLENRSFQRDVRPFPAPDSFSSVTINIATLRDPKKKKKKLENPKKWVS